MKQTIWRVLPEEAHDRPYIDRLVALGEKFRFNEIRSAYSMPEPQTDLEREVYRQFPELMERFSNPRPEYVHPLIKEFVIDNDEQQAAVLFRRQMDFAIGKGFQMQELVFFAEKDRPLEEIFENHNWTGGTALDYPLSRGAKGMLDPMLYLLRGNIVVPCVDYHGLTLQQGRITVTPEFSDTKKELRGIKK